MKRTWIILLTLTLPVLALAELPDSLWSRTFGGSNNDICYSVQQTSDGGYILGGRTISYGAGSDDFWLVRADANGDTIWTRTYGGSGHEVCYSVQQTSDGGYILGGYTSSSGAGYYDFWLVKTYPGGTEEWSRTFGGSSMDVCRSVQQTSDGGYILGGYTESYGAGGPNFWLVKADANGDSLWSRAFGGGNDDRCYSVQQTTDGGYILGGFTESYGAGDDDFWMVKTDASGTEEWSRTFGGSGSDKCHSVQQTTDAGYILGGFTFSYGAGFGDSWLVKTDTNGTEDWSQTYGGSSYDKCYSVQQTSDGGYILGGETMTYGAGGLDFWLVKANVIGTEEWSRTFGGIFDDYCQSVQQTTDGGYVLGGYTRSFGAGGYDFWLVKTGYPTTVYPDSITGNPIIRWIAPYPCDYLIYSTTNPNHDGSPPGSDWTLEVTLPSVPAGPAEWEDVDALDESYRNYVVVTSCP